MATFIYKGVSWTYNEVIGADGRIWMDRNLGATRVAISAIDTDSYGDLFQWGRLDDGHQIPTSGTTATLSSGNVPGHANFIKNGVSSPYDWRNPQNNNLWQNGLNVPAPAGWRIPTPAEWQALKIAEGITNASTAYSSALKLPLAGERHPTAGALMDQNSDGYYWASSIGNPPSTYFGFNASSANANGSSWRAYGMSIRLIKIGIPTVTTQAVSAVAKTTATGNGNVIADGGETITERGTVISTIANPTTADHKDIASGTTGAFTTSLTGLSLGTTYHIRAYAINLGGTSYGSDESFTTEFEISNRNAEMDSRVGLSSFRGVEMEVNEINFAIFINSVEKTSDILYNSFSITDYINQQVDICSFDCKKFKPNLNEEIKVYYGVDKIYGGVIVKIDTEIRAGYYLYSITCKDYSQYLNRELVSETFNNKTVTEIITSLLADYAPDFTMVNVDGASVIAQITFNRLNISQCIQGMAESLNYSWYVDNNKDIHFFAENIEISPFNLSDNGGNHNWESLKITEDFSQLKNQIYVIGGEYEAESRIESYVADGTQKQFPLVYKYKTITRVRKVGGPDLTIGIDGEDLDANFSVFWSPKQKYLRFKDSNYPSVGTVVEITGTPLFQVFIKVPDVDSIAQYGLYEFKIKDINLNTRADAIRRGFVELEAYANSIEEGSFTTVSYGLRSGQTININIGSTNEDFIIQSVSMSMITPFHGVWNVKVATVRTLGIIRFLQKFLKIEDEIVEGETLLELQQLADSSESTDNLTLTTDSPSYVWDDAGTKWNLFTWS